MDKKTILLAEDEKDIAEMYKIVFEKAGYEVVITENGEDTLNKIEAVNPDLLLLDINMPVKDGFDVLKSISEDLDLYNAMRDTPIVMLTNYNNPQDIEYCLKTGAQDYIVKSEWTPEKVLEKAKKYLAGDTGK